MPSKGRKLHLSLLDQTSNNVSFLVSLGVKINFYFYDAKPKILFSGDIGAALEDVDSPMFVENFDTHIEKMRYFHQRWMPSDVAKRAWVERVRQLDIQMMCPQHGRIFRGEQVGKFLDWFEQLPVGILNP